MSARVFFVIGGRVYRWSGWLGCQLESMEWRRVPAGTERDIEVDFGKVYRMRVFTTAKRGKNLRIRTTWCLPLFGDLDRQNAQIREFKAALRSRV